LPELDVVAYYIANVKSTKEVTVIRDLIVDINDGTPIDGIGVKEIMTNWTPVNSYNSRTRKVLF
jgi:hypothetical protein